jgi:hypothetical protein
MSSKPPSSAPKMHEDHRRGAFSAPSGPLPARYRAAFPEKWPILPHQQAARHATSKDIAQKRPVNKATSDDASQEEPTDKEGSDDDPKPSRKLRAILRPTPRDENAPKKTVRWADEIKPSTSSENLDAARKAPWAEK